MKLVLTEKSDLTVHGAGMKAIMNLSEFKKTQEYQAFLEGTQTVAFNLLGNKSSYYCFYTFGLKKFNLRKYRFSK